MSALEYLFFLFTTLLVAGVHGEDEITCGNGEVIDLAEVEEFYWFSPGWLDGDDYPKNTECKVTFSVPPRHNWNIVSIYDFDVLGDYSKGCEGGDYVQFTVNGKKAKKFCGEGWKLSDQWCWEDWCWPNTFEVVGSPDKPTLVEAVFKTGDSGKGFRSGFEIIVAPGYEWDSDEPEVNEDGIPMLPMLE